MAAVMAIASTVHACLLHVGVLYTCTISGTHNSLLLTFKAPNDILLYFFFLKKIMLDFSCESSAKQRIHMNMKSYFL